MRIPGAAVLIVFAAACAKETTDTVETPDGILYGTVSKKTAAYLGVPYAEAPVGERRFAPPVQISKFKEREATTHASVCPQFNVAGTIINSESSEDCLFLNVWAPREPGPHPVMVYFPGGSYVFGAGSESLYDGRKLSEAGKVVIVTINYRLGPFGFLLHPALPQDGNVALLDQREALRWVRRNISAFGGDAKNVTVFGESAGAGSVCAHLLSPGSWGLFERAVMESAPCTGFAFATRTQAEAQAHDVAVALGCTATDAAGELACLRAASMSQLLEALPLNSHNIYGPGVSWFPAVDGVVIEDQPTVLFAKGQIADVPIILGSNSDEGTLFFPKNGPVQDEASMRVALAELFTNPADVDAIVARYPLTPTAHEGASRVVSDIFTCDARRMARQSAKAGRTVFQYYFARDFYDVVLGLGAFHGSEMPFIWDNPYFGLSVQPAGAAVRSAMQGYWTTFARTGDPNGGNRVTWPKYDESSDSLVEFDAPVEVRSGVLSETCDFWDGLRQPSVR